MLALSTFFISSCREELKIDEAQEVSSMGTEVSSRTTPHICEQEQGNCSGSYFTRITSVSIPEYPNCTFQVQYNFRNCPPNFDIILTHWSPWPHCQEFYDDLYDNVLNGGAQLWLQKIRAKLMGAALIDHLNFSNITIPECGQGSGLNVGFVEASCINFCLGAIFDHGGGLIEYNNVIEMHCPGSACCKKIYEVCQNPDGSVHFSNGTIQQASSIQCNTVTPYLEGCPKDHVLFQPNCFDNCILLNLK